MSEYIHKDYNITTDGFFASPVEKQGDEAMT